MSTFSELGKLTLIENEELKKELETTKKQLEESLRLMSELVDDIHTPSRLGLSNEPNKDWISLNEVNQFLNKLKH